MAGDSDDLKRLEKQNHQNETNESNKENIPKFRLHLPAKMIDRSQISIWSILKQFIGKELSKIAMPAAWCEPLSFLQRITENVYYSDLLCKANDPILSADPCKRMEYVAAYAVTGISSNIDRLSKPFNPLLGETYELVREDLGFKILCEQVSHHPPISAFHSDSTDPNSYWKFYGCVNPKIKFWGKSIEVQPKGTLTLELGKFNEMYTWQTVTCCVHNIIVGKLWFEYYGTMEITCHQTGYKAILNFKPYSWSNKELNKVEGYIYDKKKNKVRALYGYWTHCLYSCDPHTFDSYTKSNKPLPMVQLDELFNVVNSPLSPGFDNRHNHSDSDLKSFNDANDEANKTNSHSIKLNSNEKAKFTLNENENEIENGSRSEFLKSEYDDEPGLLVNQTNHKLNIKNFDPASTASLPVSKAAHLNDVVELWRAVPRPSYAVDYYNFNYFAMTLNEMKAGIEKVIAPTDSRFRTDIKQLELGDLDGASSEKVRLEEKQRESRKNRKDEFKGKWFQVSKHPITNEEIWLFNNKYWSRDYSDCPKLY